MVIDGTGGLVGARDFAYNRALRDVDPHTADDLAQDAIARLLRQDPQPANLEAWLTVVVRNLVIDMHRRGNHHAQGVLSGGLPSEASLQRRGYAGTPVSGPVLDGMAIEEALAGLGSQERRAVEMHLAGHSNQDIADLFGYANKSVSAVTVSKAKRKLRAALRSMKSSAASTHS